MQIYDLENDIFEGYNYKVEPMMAMDWNLMIYHGEIIQD